MDDQQLLRYSRQIMLPDFDVAGQERLLSSRVLVVGLGGLGCPVAMYLVAAGVGELWLADHDVVELTNLQRQIAHGVADLGRSKADSMVDTLRAINPGPALYPVVARLSGEALRDKVNQVDLVVDASDNFAVRFELNAACFSAGKPLVSGAAIRSEGQVAVFDHRRQTGPCYRCLYDDQVDDAGLSCAESGVLAPLVGVIGSVQAMEAVKLLAGFGDIPHGKLLLHDAKTSQWRQLTIAADPTCPVCS